MKEQVVRAYKEIERRNTQTKLIQKLKINAQILPKT